MFLPLGILGCVVRERRHVQEAKDKLFRAALVDAAKAAELEPNNFEAHKALAIGKGRLQVPFILELYVLVCPCQ